MAGHSLFSLLRSWDARVSPSGEFTRAIDELKSARLDLLQYLDLVLSHPFVAFGGYEGARNALDSYLKAYQDLLRCFRQHEVALHSSGEAGPIRFAATQLLRLDAVYVQTPSEWKALLTPLHPFHLWRFHEVLKAVHQTERPLTEDQQNQLAQALPDLPHLIHFLVVVPEVERGVPTVLPQAGSIETIPTFENHTNRYLGTDGLEFLSVVIDRFVSSAPYTKVQLRLALVDVPDLPALLNLVAESVRSTRVSCVVIDVYFTRGQNFRSDMGRLDYHNKDYDVSELMRSGRLVVHLHAKDSCASAIDSIRAKPVHIAFFFDQAQYQVHRGPRARQLLVSPLVVSYQYDFSESFGKGTIAPSSEAEEGLFADFHLLVERTALLPAGQQIRLQFDPGADLEPINSVVDSGGARWLAVADRILTGYAPTSAVPLGERRYGQREVGVWARASSHSVDQLLDLMRRFNLQPDLPILQDLLRLYGHVASGGMLSVPWAPGGNAETRDRQQKAFLGTVLAAAWYRHEYPGALVASLDSNLARLWLHGRADNDRRADLIGLRHDAEGRLTVEVIEVKTRADESEARAIQTSDGQVKLLGRAFEQLEATLVTLRPVFGEVVDVQPLFTPARREVLKYQLHRECFREVHDASWQREWYERLSAAFSMPTRTPVDCRGIVIHVHLEENTEVPTWQDSSLPLALVTLGTQAIQQLVSERETEAASLGTTKTPQSDPVDSTSHGVETEEADLAEVAAALELPSAARESLSTEGAIAANPTALRANFSPLTAPLRSSEAVDLTRLFLRACQSFRVQVDECNPQRAVLGPTVWRLYVRLARGQRLDPLRNALEDIGREMRHSGLLVSAIPDSDEIALDVPRALRETVPLARGLAGLPDVPSPEQMPVVIGVTPEGEDIICDLSEMPHLLVGGTTKAGKTMFLYGILAALLVKHPDPTTLRLLLSTSKPEDFVFFERLRHLETGRVITDAAEAIQLLQTLVAAVFEERGQQLTVGRCRDIGSYNVRNPTHPLPPFVVVVDEFADLADQLAGNRAARDAFYTNIRRVAQLGRSRGIHLILCTQRPSANLVPTDIRNLMNARVALRVNDAITSRMILEENGAEQLQMRGDLLFKSEGGLKRAQGYFVEADELDALLRPMRE